MVKPNWICFWLIVVLLLSMALIACSGTTPQPATPATSPSPPALPTTPPIPDQSLHVLPTQSPSVSPPQAPIVSQPALLPAKKYVGSNQSNKYHYPSCEWAQKIKSANEIRFKSIAEALAKGYVACKVCKPPSSD